MANDSQTLTVQFSFTLIQVMDVVRMAEMHHKHNYTPIQYIKKEKIHSQKIIGSQVIPHMPIWAFKGLLVTVIVPPLHTGCE